MKKFENLGRMLSKAEQKRIGGGDPPPDNCQLVCANCVILTMNCSGDCIPNDGYGIWCDGVYHECEDLGTNHCS